MVSINININEKGGLEFNKLRGIKVDVEYEIKYKDATIQEKKVAKSIKERIGTENEIVNECKTEEGKKIENLLNALLKL